MACTMLLWYRFAHFLWMLNRMVSTMLMRDILAMFLRNMFWYIMTTLLGNLGAMFLGDMFWVLNYKYDFGRIKMKEKKHKSLSISVGMLAIILLFFRCMFKVYKCQCNAYLIFATTVGTLPLELMLL